MPYQTFSPYDVGPPPPQTWSNIKVHSNGNFHVAGIVGGGDSMYEQARNTFASIRKLIEARAKYIISHQVVKSGTLKDAIVPGDNRTMEPFLDPATRLMPTTLAYGLSDALFLADKNTLYPNKAEIAALAEVAPPPEQPVIRLMNFAPRDPPAGEFGHHSENTPVQNTATYDTHFIPTSRGWAVG
jgi:hypothetical protein